ncbi:hypothetical protein Tco_0717810 [Tanacetum coccineum]
MYCGSALLQEPDSGRVSQEEDDDLQTEDVGAVPIPSVAAGSEGIWITRCAGIETLTIAMDTTCTDGRELRGDFILLHFSTIQTAILKKQVLVGLKYTRELEHHECISVAEYKRCILELTTIELAKECKRKKGENKRKKRPSNVYGGRKAVRVKIATEVRNEVQLQQKPLAKRAPPNDSRGLQKLNNLRAQQNCMWCCEAYAQLNIQGSEMATQDLIKGLNYIRFMTPSSLDKRLLMWEKFYCFLHIFVVPEGFSSPKDVRFLFF